jgi:RecA-family ATPase
MVGRRSRVSRPKIARPTDLAPIKILDPIQWQDQPAPERRWLVADLIPLHNVTMLSGDGGLGKSIIALQLMAACALGKLWLGRQTMACKAFGLFCEDDEGELRRRLADICRHHDAEFGDLENLQLCERVGLENSLMEWQSAWEAGETTWLHAQVMNHALEFGAQTIVIDSLHDVFTGDEIRRSQARQFIQGLREIAREIDGAVLLTAHPSLSGRNSGTGESGSTAWNNSVRSRLYFKEAGAQSGAERILKTMKSNYARRGGEIQLRWDAGAYVEIPDDPGMVGSLRRGNAEKVFLACLDRLTEQGRHVTDAANSPRFAPRHFAEMPEANGFEARDFKGAMERLFAVGTIRIGAAIGSDRHKVKAIIRTGQEAPL